MMVNFSAFALFLCARVHNIWVYKFHVHLFRISFLPHPGDSDTCTPVGMRRGNCSQASVRHVDPHISWHTVISMLHIVAVTKGTDSI